MGDQGMFRKLVKATEIVIDGRSYGLRYFEQTTARGSWRYSCEVLLGAADRIILDDDSMTSAVSRQPSAISSQLSAVSGQLSALRAES
jgi:hypothetical protein